MSVIEKKTKYQGIRLRNNIVWIFFHYKRQKCRESFEQKLHFDCIIKSKLNPKNKKFKKEAGDQLKENEKKLSGANDKRTAIKYAITIQTFNYIDFFPHSKGARKFGSQTNTIITVSEALDWWWESNKPEDENTASDHECNIKNHIKPGIGKIILSDLKSRQVKHWINSIDLAASTKNNILSPLRKMFAEAYSDELIDDDIMLRIKNFKKIKKKKNPLNIKQVDNILKDITEKHANAFYEFAFWSGLSTGEQTGLKWGNINFTENKYYVRGLLSSKGKIKDTKNEYREREIDLLQPLYNALVKIMPDNYFELSDMYADEFVFKNPKTGAYWKTDALTKIWRRTLNNLKIPYRKPYETRHAYASIMVTACLPDGWIRRQMGHASMRMLEEVYGKWLGDANKVIDWVLKHTKGEHNGEEFKKLFIDKYS